MLKLTPHLIQINLDNEFVLIVNPFFKNGVRIINKRQVELIKLFNGEKSIENISRESGYDVNQIKSFVSLLRKNNCLVEEELSKDLCFKHSDKVVDFWVHTTDSCNLRCHYCYIHTKDAPQNIELNVIEKFQEKILQTVKARKLKLVILRLAGGEPFLRFDLWKSNLLRLKKQLERFECKLNVTFLTNLTLLNDDIINFIKAENFNISVSLDGLGSYHDKARPYANGKGSFDVILKNIFKLIDNGISPYIMTVVSDDNLDGLVDFTKFLVDYNLSFRYSIVQADHFNYEKAFAVFKKVYSFLGEEIDKGYPFESKHQFGELKLLNIFDQNCGAGRDSGTIYSNGDIYFCQQQVGTKEIIGSIFSDEDLLDIVKKGNYFNDNLSDECQECNYRYVCTGGCPLVRIDGKSPSCDFYKKIIPILYRLIGKERLYSIKKIISASSIE